MKRLILLAIALVITSGAGAYAQSEQGAGKYTQLVSYHRAHHSHGYGGYGRMDDPSAEGRTSG